jgi:hypothetical protein
MDQESVHRSQATGGPDGSPTRTVKGSVVAAIASIAA